MYSLSFANSSNASLNSKKSSQRPPAPSRAVSDSAASPLAISTSATGASSGKRPFKGLASPFKRSTKEAGPAQRPPPSPEQPMPFPSTSTSSQHSYSQSVPSFAASVPNPSASRQSTLLDPRASVIARHRTSSSPSGLGIPAGALHMAKLANGNIKTFAAKAKRHLNDLSSNSATQDRAASPLARFSKKFPTHRNRSTSQPLSGLDTKAAAASGGSPSRLTTPTSPNSTIFGIKVPRDQFSKVFGVPLQEAAKGTRLLSPDRLDTDKMVLSATRSSQDFDDRARQRMEAKAYLPGMAIRCLEYVETWVSEEGLYRVSGSHHQVQQLKTLFDAGCDLDLRNISTAELDPHSVTGLFKLWLRELPHALFSPEVESMLDGLLMRELGLPATQKHSLAFGQTSEVPKRSAHWTVGNPNPDLVDKIAILLSTLSLDRWHILRELANHLALLDMHSKENKMTLSNLRLILSPTLHVSPAMLQLLVEQRRFLFDKERAHALATPSTSPVELVPPRANVDGDSIHSAPPAIKSFAKQQETLDASLAAAWEVDDFPKQRLSSQSGPLPPIASRFTAGPSSASARAPSPSSTSTRSRAVSKSNGSNTTFWVQKQSSDAGSTTRGSSTSVATFDRAGRRRSRSLSALADSVIAPHASPEPPVGMLPRAPQQSEAEDSGTEDLEVSSASSSSDLEARRSIMTVETSAEEDQKFGRKGSVQSEESAEILQASTAAKGSRSPSPAPSLRLSFDTFSSSFLDGEVAALPWTSSEKR